jgi:hypothetical protein
VAGPEVGGASDRHQRDKKGEQDRAGEGEREVPGREGEREVQIGDLLDRPDEKQVEQVAERDPDQPARGGEGEGLGGEDATDGAGAGADRAEDADLAGAFEDDVGSGLFLGGGVPAARWSVLIPPSRAGPC